MNAASPGESLRLAIQSARSVLLTGPMFPDGDSIGACLALARAIRHIGSARVDVAGEIPLRYAWMPGADDILADEVISADYDLVVVLDGDCRRLPPPIEAAFHAATMRGIVDHHSSTSPDDYDIALIDASAASTCEMVYELLLRWDVPVDQDLAALLYTGLIFDTGGFRHSNTTAETHRLAATLLDTGLVHTPINIAVLMERRREGLKLMGHVLERTTFHGGGIVALGVVDLATCERLGCTVGDIEGIIDALVFTRGVELACLCVEKGEAMVKLSLRSRKKVDVANLARRLHPGGGGHPRAAGAMIPESLSDLLTSLPGVLYEAAIQS
ncbi:MAG: phosphoesterase RecJ-like protein [Myxococcota bacterium]|jgi:phosphoesterase RecJ-like protein